MDETIAPGGRCALTSLEQVYFYLPTHSFSSIHSLVEASDGDRGEQVSVDSPAAAASLGTL